jgi:predicted Zn-dependent protease with MMP-like domain
MCLRLVVDMVQPWVFHDESLSRDVFGQIEVLIDDVFDPIILMGNSTRSGQVMHEMFLGSKESLFGVYFGSGLVPINEYRFGPHGVQSWLELIKML